MWTEDNDTQSTCSYDEHPLTEEGAVPALDSALSTKAQAVAPRDAAANLVFERGWPVPSTISANPEEARGCVPLQQFDVSLLEIAKLISSRFPSAEARYRNIRSQNREEIPHFEKVFRIATAMAGVASIEETTDYDELLILTAWQCVRPGVDGFLGSYPKSLLCPLSHAASPVALNALSTAKRQIFDRRAPIYLRYLLLEKFRLRTCGDIENADLRLLLKSTGFRLIRPSAVPEVAFRGITQGEDPPVRPWKLALRQELSDDRAAEMLIQAGLWQIKYGLRLVTFDDGFPRWNIGAFARTDWEDAFLSLGVRIAPALTRESGLLDWRAVLARCLKEIGTGNLPADLVGKVCAQSQRVCHDSEQAIWDVLDRAARTVLERVRVDEPQLFVEGGELNYATARSFRRWARLFDEVSPNILSRFGVSAFTALHRVAPEYFGWGRAHLKPWELEQEHGKWKGPRGRALLRSAYAYALHQSGLGSVDSPEGHVVWHCTRKQFSEWSARKAKEGIGPFEFLYRIASQNGLTPLLNREITHTATVSLLAGMNLHEHLPAIEGCWEMCMCTALDRHSGRLEVRLPLPDLVPLPLRLRNAVLAPLTYGYLHSQIRLVRSFDLRMARESHRTLEDIPGWWDDERIIGTPLIEHVSSTDSPARGVLGALCHEPWLESRRIRFRALHLLISRRATTRTAPEETALSSNEIRVLLRLALSTLEHTNIAQVSLQHIRRGFERILAREDTRELLESLLLHVGTAYETELWGQVRKFIVLDVINDLLALSIRTSLLHMMGAE